MNVCAFKHKEIESTVGIDCSIVKMANGKVSVFDFGGQLEYTVTHQFFLSSKVTSHFFTQKLLTLIN